MPSPAASRQRAVGFGMPAQEVDGHDFFAVYEAAGTAIARARKGEGPSLIHVRLNRYYGHFEGDATTYRAPGEVETLRRERDCLAALSSARDGIEAAGAGQTRRDRPGGRQGH